MHLYAKASDYRTQRILACAKINEINVSSPPQSKEAQRGSIPVLDTGKGCIFGTGAISRYVSRMRPDIGLYGQNFLENGEVDSWCEFIHNEIEIPMDAWIFPLLKMMPTNPECKVRAQIDLKESLSVINKHLLHRTFLVGHKLTLSDILLASVLHSGLSCPEAKADLEKMVMNNSQYVNIRRWFDLISNQPHFKSYFPLIYGEAKQAKKTDNSSKTKAPANKSGKDNKKADNQNKKADNQNKKADNQNKKVDNKKSEGNKKAENKKESTPAEDREKLKKKSVKEGGKRGVEVEGAAAMGGLDFFNVSVFESDGDLELLKLTVDAMNAECDPSEEERRGGAGKIGKMVFSAGVEQLAITCHVPAIRQGKTDATVWLKAVLKELKDEKSFVSGDKTLAYAVIKKSAGKFPIKLKDEGLVQANAYLRKNGLFPDVDDEEDEEFVFGDDDFPEM